MDLTFKLSTGEIYIFKDYVGLSELIEQLELKPDEMIEIVESFSLEELEKANSEYRKYINFKNALDDIITNRKLWEKDDLIKLSKYNLNNPVLEWLIVKDTDEEKEFKEKVSLKTFIRDLENESIILTYITEGSNTNKFIYSARQNWLGVAKWLFNIGLIYSEGDFKIVCNDVCEEGYVEMAKWLYSINKDNFDLHYQNDLKLKLCCGNGHLEMAKWLFSLDKSIMGQTRLKYSLFEVACENGHLEMAQWIYGESKFRLNNQYLISKLCEIGQLEILKWLHSLEENEFDFGSSNAFSWACQKCHLDVMKWLYSLGKIDINSEMDWLFYLICILGNLEIAKWLYCNGVNIYIDDGKAMFWVCEKGYLEFAKWLYSIMKPLGYFNKEKLLEKLKTKDKDIREWLDLIE